MAEAEAEAEVDRISLLPLEIKISILSLLAEEEVEHAVRTSALSRSWRHIWTHLPCLYLSSERNLLDNDHTVPSSWIQRVHCLVSSLRGPLSTFHILFWGVMAHDDQPVLQSLLHLLLQKGVLKTLNLIFHHDPGKIHLPWFHSLQVLRLCGCHVVLPTDFRGFHRLENLRMCSVQISNDDLDLLLRTSNNLTTLVIADCQALGNPLSVNLSLPLLRHLEFEFFQFVGNLSVVSSPCLEHAGFQFRHASYSSQNLAKMMLRLVTNVAMVSSLILNFDVFKCFSLVTLPFYFTFSRLKFLRFYLNVDTMDRRVYDSFFRLLRSMPFLEELQVGLERDYDFDQADRVAILIKELLAKKHDDFACLEETVTNVTITMHTLDVFASIAWIQFFLLNAKGLKLLKIDYSAGGHLIPSFIEELQKQEVTSSDAKVMFYDRYTCQITNVCMND